MQCVHRPVLLALVSAVLASVAEAQPRPASRPGSARVIVRDATDLPVAAAQVVLTASDGSTLTTFTSESGTAVFEGLAPGAYAATIEAAGFTPAEVSDISVRSGARASRDVVLQIAGLVEQLDVVPADADRQLLDAFATQLSASQIEALPDDPEELVQVLQQMVGGDAEIRVDGFAGGQLPPGTQIQDVRIRYDAASADSRGGGPRIEIRTRPGGDRWRSNAGFTLRDESLNARNAFSRERPSGQTRQYSWSVDGPLVRNQTGLSFSVDRSESLEQQAVRAAAPSGLFASLIDQPSTRLGISGRVEHALSPAQRLRVEVRRNANESLNQGIGEFDLPERAYARDAVDGQVRIGHEMTLQRRFVNELRVQLAWRTAESNAASDATAIRVLDAFASGGAQIQGGRRTRSVEIEDELELTLARVHQVSTGFTINGSTESGDEWRNAGGTFTFASLETFAAGQPTTFTQRVGDPRFDYSLFRYGWFVQDDYRVRRNLMLNLGVRHELQTHLKDWTNFAPRLGVNWTPLAAARTAIRASYGVTFVPFEGSVYEQALLVNGRRQRDVVIAGPGFPDPFLSGVEQAQRAPGIVRTHPGLEMPSRHRVSLGFDQPLMRGARLRATYSRETGRDLFRSRDVNAPVNGARPDPAARNVTQIESTGRSLGQSLEVRFSYNYQPRRFNSEVTYTLGEARNDTDGALSLPPDSFDLSSEWGASRQDIRHRVAVSLNSDLWAGFRVASNFRAQSASPYNITTGFDANGDGNNNERPDGIGRNSARGAGTRNLDLTLTWGYGIGQRGGANAQRPQGGGGGGRGDNPSRVNNVFRFEIYARATNALNLVNPQSFSGVMTSPFFGRPTSAAAARRIVIGTRLFF
jgi:hypothetical protein